MKIIKKGENAVAIEANERSEDNLEEVSGGFKTHNLTSGDYFVFNKAETKELIKKVDDTYIWLPKVAYSCETLSKILNCECDVNSVKEALRNRLNFQDY